MWCIGYEWWFWFWFWLVFCGLWLMINVWFFLVMLVFVWSWLGCMLRCEVGVEFYCCGIFGMIVGFIWWWFCFFWFIVWWCFDDYRRWWFVWLDGLGWWWWSWCGDIVCWGVIWFWWLCGVFCFMIWCGSWSWYDIVEYIWVDDWLDGGVDGRCVFVRFCWFWCGLYRECFWIWGICKGLVR